MRSDDKDFGTDVINIKPHFKSDFFPIDKYSDLIVKPLSWSSMNLWNDIAQSRANSRLNQQQQMAQTGLFFLIPIIICGKTGNSLASRVKRISFEICICLYVCM